MAKLTQERLNAIALSWDPDSDDRDALIDHIGALESELAAATAALADLDKRANKVIGMMAGEIVNSRIVNHKRFHATRKNPRGSITLEAEALIEAHLVAELDALGFELHRRNTEATMNMLDASDPQPTPDQQGGQTC